MNEEKFLYHNGPSLIISEPNTPITITPPKSFSVQCGHCFVAFTQTKNLLRHLRSQHNMNESHRCPACPTFFGSLTTLNEHEETVHLHQPLPTCQLASATVEFTTQVFNSRFQIHRMKKEDSGSLTRSTACCRSKTNYWPFLIQNCKLREALELASQSAFAS